VAKKTFQNPRGTYDILPIQFGLYDYVVNNFKNLSQQAGYLQIETPTIEPVEIFTRGVGEDTDIVEKEMYIFNDRSGNKLALKPEGTAPVVRAYIQHGMSSQIQPVKLFYASSMFRYGRPQTGRQRQFNSIGVEAIGEGSPNIDAHIIALANRFFHKIGLQNVSLQINSIGDETCRPKFKEALKNYFKSNHKLLCQDCRRRLKHNPLRILDCKEKRCQTIIERSPQTLDYLCKNCNSHFRKVLEYLDEMEITYELNSTLVRGLDYYTRTVFEFYGLREGAQSSLGGGGRYDGLIELMGGQSTPGVGFGLGVERIILELESQNLNIVNKPKIKAYVISLGESARLAAFRLIEDSLENGISVEGVIGKGSISAQFAKADKIGAPYAIIIGQKEVFDQTCILRDMVSGAQEIIPITKIVSELQKRFSKEKH